MTFPLLCVDCKHYEPENLYAGVVANCNRRGVETDLVTGEERPIRLYPHDERGPFTSEELTLLNTYGIVQRCGPLGQFWKAREESDEATPTVGST